MGYQFEFEQKDSSIPSWDSIEIWGEELVAFRNIMRSDKYSLEDTAMLEEMLDDFDTEKEKRTKFKYRNPSVTEG